MYLKGLFNKHVKSAKFVKESYEIIDKELWNQFTSNPSFPYLVSFPRTGSHWLRNVMELYFEKPSLIRVFYYSNPKDFTCYHIHDEDLSFNEPRPIIYLYRNPIATIFSQMIYYKEDLNNEKRIFYWANLYGKHLHKWLIEYDSHQKVLLNYDKLQVNFVGEFSKLILFFNETLNEKKLVRILQQVSKTKIKEKVKDDENVINDNLNYQIRKDEFIKKYQESILEKVYAVNPKLTLFF